MLFTAPNDECPKKATPPKPDFKSVEDWLKYYKLGKYEEAFEKSGFDDIRFIGQDIIDDKDVEAMEITCNKDQRVLFEALKVKGFCQGLYAILSFLFQSRTKAIDYSIGSIHVAPIRIFSF